jgi:type I restriction enzyme S subunit
MSLQTFFDNFALLADAPNGVAKLRELVLQLAMQGKLTRNWRKKNSYSKEATWKSVDFFSFCVLQRGYDLPLSTREDGNFPIVTSAGIAAYHSEFKAKAPGVVVGRSGSIGKVFYIEEDFWAHNTTLYVRDFKGNLPRYVYYYLLNFKAQQFSRSTAVPTLNRNHLRGFVVDVPSHEEQKQIVMRIEELMRLCDELEARQQARRASRVRLNNATLAPLNNAATLAPEEFEQASARLADNFAVLYDSAETVGRLRSTILQLAVQGKLVQQNLNNEPASLLIEKIKAKKAKMIKEKQIGKSEPLPPIEPYAIPIELPKGWSVERLGNLVLDLQNGISKRKSDSGEPTPVLRLADIKVGQLSENSLREIRLTSNEIIKYRVARGDIITVFN